MGEGKILHVQHWIRSFSGHNNSVTSLALLSNGKLASGSEDNKIKIWNLETYKEIGTIITDSLIYSLVALSNGWVAGGSEDGTIKIWNSETRQLIKTLRGHSDEVYSLVVLSNGWLASGSHDGSINIWGC